MAPQIRTITPARQRVLNAIEAGHMTLEAISQAVGVVSRSTIGYHLRCLERDGHIVLCRQGKLTHVDRGLHEFAAGWDAAARLAGNPYPDAAPATTISFDLLYDAEYAEKRAAGPHGVRVFPLANPESDWSFTLIGFPDASEALKAAEAEIARRQRAGQWPPDGC